MPGRQSRLLIRKPVKSGKLSYSCFKEIQAQPEKVFEMIRLDVREAVGKYLSEIMNAEITHFLGRERYERQGSEPDYRNGSYSRHFAIKGIGDVSVRVPRDRDGKYETQVIPTVNNTKMKFVAIFASCS